MEKSSCSTSRRDLKVSCYLGGVQSQPGQWRVTLPMEEPASGSQGPS